MSASIFIDARECDVYRSSRCDTYRIALHPHCGASRIHTTGKEYFFGERGERGVKPGRGESERRARRRGRAAALSTDNRWCLPPR